MQKLILKISLFAAIFFVLPNSAEAWSKNFDMETVDTSIGVGTFGSTISSEHANSGNNSFKVPLLAGVENDGQHTFSLGGDLHEGDELWARVFIYVPIGFDWTAIPITKLLRIAPARADGTEWAYHSILATNKNNYGCGSETTFGFMVTGSENNSSQSPPPICQNRNTGDGGAYMTSGQWNSIELYIKVSAINGVIRAWHNGILRNEYFYPTIPSDGYIPWNRTTSWTQHHLLGWWNGGPSKNQDIYFDDLVLTNEVPASRDIESNPMIGANIIDIIAPNAPIGLVVI
ncbi:MAG: hypothetical protein HGA36_03145 [Candidatus Moranbacteria bacterium]|nr:hypothetical protein [Candidatus Moranbacteria bacterium]